MAWDSKLFVDLNFSLIGSILNIPKVELINEDSLKPLTIIEAQHGKFVE